MPRNQWDDVPTTPEPEPTLSDLQNNLKSMRGYVWLLGSMLLIALILSGVAMAQLGGLENKVVAQGAVIETLKGKAEQAATSPVTAMAMADTASISELRNKLTEYHALAEQTAADLDKYQREWNSIYLNGK
jgi:hypothetical protein